MEEDHKVRDLVRRYEENLETYLARTHREKLKTRHLHGVDRLSLDLESNLPNTLIPADWPRHSLDDSKPNEKSCSVYANSVAAHNETKCQMTDEIVEDVIETAVQDACQEEAHILTFIKMQENNANDTAADKTLKPVKEAVKAIEDRNADLSIICESESCRLQSNEKGVVSKDPMPEVSKTTLGGGRAQRPISEPSIIRTQCQDEASEVSMSKSNDTGARLSLQAAGDGELLTVMNHGSEEQHLIKSPGEDENLAQGTPLPKHRALWLRHAAPCVVAVCGLAASILFARRGASNPGSEVSHEADATLSSSGRNIPPVTSSGRKIMKSRIRAAEHDPATWTGSLMGHGVLSKIDQPSS